MSLSLVGFSATVLATIIFLYRRWRDQSKLGNMKNRVQVLVLGDLGRSPRMQFHALSLAKGGKEVDFIGIAESPLLEEIVSHPLIRVHPLPPLPSFLNASSRSLFLVLAPIKLAFQTAALIYILAVQTRPAKYLLVQNPPSLPTLPIAILIGLLRGTHVIVDWHNFGFSILALRLGPRHPLVRLAAASEMYFGRMAWASLAVTNVFASRLQQEPFDFKHRLIAVHDRPGPHFQPLRVLAKLNRRSEQDQRLHILRECEETADFADEILRSRRHLLVSSTSWTPDEDFSVLLRTLEIYCQKAVATPMLVIITGKGPLLPQFHERLRSLDPPLPEERITIRTTFLPSPRAYAQLLAAADLGLCFHTSSSGLDLPMKVVDMFGAGLPVLAYNGYESFGELVQDGINGKGFRNAKDLAKIMDDLLIEGERGQKTLEALRQGALKESENRWDDEWGSTMGALVGI